MSGLSSLVRMRLAIGVTVAAVVMAGVLVATRSDDKPLQVAAEVGASTTTEAQPVATTVTTAALPVEASTTLPPLLPKTTTTVRRTTTTVAVSAGSGSRCGTPSGNLDLGASRTTTTGSVTTTIEVFPCEVYEDDYFAVHVTMKDPTSVVRGTHLAYGDGHVGNKAFHHWACGDPQRPDPYYMSAGPHTYAAPGAYTLTGTVTTASCADWDETRQEGSPQTSKVSITVYRMAGKRPPSS